MTRDLSPLSDDDLLTRYRAGDGAAYGELWRRHSSAARSVAVGFRGFDADDIVSEAFLRVHAATQNGKGPSASFRAYLCATARSVGTDWARKQTPVLVDDLDSRPDPDGTSPEEQAISLAGTGVTRAAFESLPTRYQEALWYGVVDKEKPAAFSRYLGLTPNAASQLLARAKRAFRAAFIARNVAQAASPECRDALAQVADRDSITSAEFQELVDLHLAECTRCAIVIGVSRDPSEYLGLVLIPLTVGAGGAAAYTAWTQNGSIVATTVAAPPVVTAVRSAARSAARSLPRPRAAVVAASSAVALTLAGVVVAAALTASSVTVADAGTGGTPAPAAPAASAPSATTPTTPAPDAASPSRSPAAPQSPAAPRVPTDRTTPAEKVDAATAVTGPATTAPGRDPSGPASASPETEPTPAPTTEPDPDPEPTDPPVAAPVPAPEMLLDTTAGPLVYPSLTGSTARPGSHIRMLDETGTVVALTDADDAGAWTVDDFAPQACTSGAPGLSSGTHTLTATQTVDGVVSPASAPVTFTLSAAPAIVDPANGQTVQAADFTLRVTGEPGATVQRIKFPDPSPCRPVPMRLDQSGVFTASFFALNTGTLTIGVRYVDPATGRHGPATSVTFDAE